MIGLSIPELICLKDIVEADMDRSEWAGAVPACDWKCVELMTFYRTRASAFAKLKMITEGTKE